MFPTVLREDLQQVDDAKASPSSVKLTANQREVLESLYNYGKGGNGVSPLYFGGHNGSHHGATATKMCSLGWVQRRYRGHDWGEALRNAARGSCVYRITAAGVEALMRDRGIDGGEAIQR
jgi:hypothetical protein